MRIGEKSCFKIYVILVNLLKVFFYLLLCELRRPSVNENLEDGHTVNEMLPECDMNTNKNETD